MKTNLTIILYSLILITAALSPVLACGDDMDAAIRNGDLQGVFRLLESGCNIESPNEAGDSALLQACLADQEEIALALIDKGANVNVQPQRHGLTPLMIASVKGMEQAVQSLISSGAAVNAQGLRGQTPLYFSVFSKNPRIVQLLLEAGADPNLNDELNQAPLFFAANAGQVEMVKMLLEYGANVNNRGGGLEQDALMAASIQGNYEIAKLLLEKDAKFHIPDKQGMTALKFASQLGHTDIVNLFLARYAHPLLPPFVESMKEKQSAVEERKAIQE
ncbi:ankyrin repeat domain-containing protein [Desulfatibacillum aliphaticivorans]|uniref:ankyrin repeat domain-containing protein n=1 Tax=Desulfatibacillum aliphaticivorans TaxID=218208 RepID=UPI00041F3D00|nr:ankyrin repeat domain-containing protein [Desulfatibacillum aliphaticivorans]